MKKNSLILASFIIAAMMFIQGNNLYSQTAKSGNEMEQASMKSCGQGGCMKHCNIPDLTPEQEKKIEDLKLKLHKELLPLKLQIQEKKAHLKVLETAEVADYNAINATIDEIAGINSKIMKLKAKNKQDIRNLLTEKQRIAFDSKGCCKGKSKNKGQGQMGSCQGQGGKAGCKNMGGCKSSCANKGQMN